MHPPTARPSLALDENNPTICEGSFTHGWAMLERQISPGGIVTYFSPLLRRAGVRHAFSTRIGGTSPKPFDSLNLGNPNGCAIQDLSERIRHNYRLLFQATGCAENEHAWLHQIHGSRVVCVRSGDSHTSDEKADGLVSDDPNRVLSVRVADCVPVLLSTGDGRIVAAVHAGWRGVIAGVVVESLREMIQMGNGHPKQILAAIGPSIGFDAFEVGPEVLEEFVCVFGTDAPIRHSGNDKGRVDLREALRRQLLGAGVLESNIDLTDRCTHRDADEFFSHRRDRGISGRMAAIIAASR
jgi:YfiH family protein